VTECLLWVQLFVNGDNVTKLTQERLKELLDYDPVSGLFTWRVSTARSTKVGSIAGCLRPSGLRSISVDNIAYQASHLVYLFMTGNHPPDGYVKHLNGDRGNDSWSNLQFKPKADRKPPQEKKPEKVYQPKYEAKTLRELYPDRFRDTAPKKKTPVKKVEPPKYQPKSLQDLYPERFNKTGEDNARDNIRPRKISLESLGLDKL